MEYYSTRNKSGLVNLSQAVLNGLANDGGLYMPVNIKKLSYDFFDNIDKLSDVEIAFIVANALFGEDIDKEALYEIVKDTVNFPCPIEKVTENIYSLELFHGPTLAFKDFGARFMSRLLRYIIKTRGIKKGVNVLVATSGDTGSAVANGFYDVDGINVYVLYPKDKVSKAQEAQFATLGGNIKAVEVKGTFDDCQRIVKEAFVDDELNRCLFLTSANSINVARLLPQTFYYFIAYAKLKKSLVDKSLVVSVPSGNFGNLMAGMVAWKMGLPISRFIAANNANDVFFNYIKTGNYEPKPSVATVANAMDVGNPSNFERILDLFGDWDTLRQHVQSYTFSDAEIKKTIRDCKKSTGYLLDPHGTCAFLALKESLEPGELGLFLETAHPSKFKSVIDESLNESIDMHLRLKEFLNRQKEVVTIEPTLVAFKNDVLSKNRTIIR